MAYLAGEGAEAVLEGGWFGCLGKERHTVARAELLALAKALEFTEGPLTVYSDCLYVVEGFAEQRWNTKGTTNEDLWQRVARELGPGAGARQVQAKWVKAHADTGADIVHHRLTADQAIGNAVADALAKRGAELGQDEAR